MDSSRVCDGERGARVAARLGRFSGGGEYPQCATAGGGTCAGCASSVTRACLDCQKYCRVVALRSSGRVVSESMPSVVRREVRRRERIVRRRAGGICWRTSASGAVCGVCCESYAQPSLLVSEAVLGEWDEKYHPAATGIRCESVNGRCRAPECTSKSVCFLCYGQKAADLLVHFGALCLRCVPAEDVLARVGALPRVRWNDVLARCGRMTAATTLPASSVSLRNSQRRPRHVLVRVCVRLPV